MILGLLALGALGPPILPDPPSSAEVEPPGVPEQVAPPAEPAPPEGPVEEPPAPEVSEPPAPDVSEPPPEPLEPPAPLVDELADAELLGPQPAARDGHVRVKRPRFRGTGQFAISGVSFGMAVLIQTVDSLAFGSSGFGIAERVFLAAAMGTAAGGGITRGHADAYDDAAFRRTPLDTRKTLIAGAALVGTGAVLGLVNEGLWWRCAFNESGPYFLDDDENFFAYPCRYGLNRGLLDLASGMTTAGLGMLTWSLVYRRDTKAYERARVVALHPTFGAASAGLTVEGRF